MAEGNVPGIVIYNAVYTREGISLRIKSTDDGRFGGDRLIPSMRAIFHGPRRGKIAQTSLSLETEIVKKCQIC